MSPEFANVNPSMLPSEEPLAKEPSVRAVWNDHTTHLEGENPGAPRTGYLVNFWLDVARTPKDRGAFNPSRGHIL